MIRGLIGDLHFWFWEGSVKSEVWGRASRELESWWRVIGLIVHSSMAFLETAIRIVLFWCEIAYVLLSSFTDSVQGLDEFATMQYNNNEYIPQWATKILIIVLILIFIDYWDKDIIINFSSWLCLQYNTKIEYLYSLNLQEISRKNHQIKFSSIGNKWRKPSKTVITVTIPERKFNHAADAGGWPFTNISAEWTSIKPCWLT